MVLGKYFVLNTQNATEYPTLLQSGIEDISKQSATL